jgi:hypothetical protein
MFYRQKYKGDLEYGTVTTVKFHYRYATVRDYEYRYGTRINVQIFVL